jgi:hypothetical protein|tara:strand:- start:1344 stop:2321 length:978 start_codon:yes stop_codon:yes gene_type:complete
MMNADTNAQFEEPEGLPEPDDDDLEIEVLDDTPEEDIREARPAADRMDVDGDEFEQEIKDYSENAQKRIKAVKFEFHEERRSKEAAQRQAEEATRYAEQVAGDNQALKQSLDNSNKVLTEQFDARTDAELEKAKSEFKEAYEGGDTDALVEAQQTLSRLQAERVSVRFNRPAPQQQQQQQQQQPQQQLNAPLPQQDARAASWLRNNAWFHASGSEDMTGYAVGLHQKLVHQGLNPATDEEYYTKIDQGMRTVFPDRFSESDQGGTEVNTSAANNPRKKPPVGGPSRGGKPPRKVQLTATQVALAKRLGLSNKQYAAQVAKEQLNG